MGGFNILASSHHVQILHLFKESSFFFFVCIAGISNLLRLDWCYFKCFLCCCFFPIREDGLEGQVVRAEAADWS